MAKFFSCLLTMSCVFGQGNMARKPFKLLVSCLAHTHDSSIPRYEPSSLVDTHENISVTALPVPLGPGARPGARPCALHLPLWASITCGVDIRCPGGCTSGGITPTDATTADPSPRTSQKTARSPGAQARARSAKTSYSAAGTGAGPAEARRTATAQKRWRHCRFAQTGAGGAP